jgi:hypothetical protein
VYRLQVFRDSILSNLYLEDITFDTTYTLKVGTSSDTLYWRIKTDFPGDEVRSFSFSAAKGFSSVLPNDRDTIQTNAVTLRWGNDPCAKKYEVHHQSRFGAVQDTLTDTLIVLSNLRDNEVYTWKVRGIYDSGVGDWTADRTFYYRTIADVYEGNDDYSVLRVVREAYSNDIEIIVLNNFAQDYSLTLVDLLGQPRQDPVQVASSRFLVDSSTLCKGTYIVRLQNATTNVSRVILLD